VTTAFFHVNDVHAHLDEFSSTGTDCTRPDRGCFGGYSRIKTVLDAERPKHPDNLLLNVGDEFQGTLFYSFYGGEKIAQTLNQLDFDAMTLGNHEFDGGEEKLGDFLNNLTFPIVCANLKSANKKVAAKVKPYQIFEQYGLAVIGVTTADTPSISNPDDGTIFADVVESVQNAINEIKSTTNIKRIAAITHIGYEEDQKLAEATSGLQLIMGGHSHTLIGDMPNAKGKYPTIVDNKDGDEVFIVTAYRWGEYLGYIDVTYDPQGKILAYHGAPLHLTNTTKQEPGLQAQIKEWRGPFEKFAAEVIGQSQVELDQTTCQRQECLLGDFMTDAMLAYRRNNTKDVDFAMINAGGIRATIDEGPITRGEVLTSFPFGNAIVQIALTGKQIWDVLEGIVSTVNVGNRRAVTSFFQVSTGIKVDYNPKAANGSRLVSVDIGGKPLQNSTTYQVVTLDFLAGGGDNFFNVTTDFIVLDTQDEVLSQYVQSQSPVNIKLDKRIEAVDRQRPAVPGAGNGTTNGTRNGTATSSARPSQPVSTGAAAQFGASAAGVSIFGVFAGLLML
jgi:2',3'-cyclic-nucleotide 2'-phosphodiesterase (5'-nucleotidase family)